MAAPQISRQTLQLAHDVLAGQQLNVGHPQFGEAAQAYVKALAELRAAIGATQP